MLSFLTPLFPPLPGLGLTMLDIYAALRSLKFQAPTSIRIGVDNTSQFKQITTFRGDRCIIKISMHYLDASKRACRTGWLDLGEKGRHNGLVGDIELELNNLPLLEYIGAVNWGTGQMVFDVRGLFRVRIQEIVGREENREEGLRGR
jgi:hypothetical protein